jgi:hypothetical protein
MKVFVHNPATPGAMAEHEFRTIEERDNIFAFQKAVEDGGTYWYSWDLNVNGVTLLFGTGTRNRSDYTRRVRRSRPRATQNR